MDIQQIIKTIKPYVLEWIAEMEARASGAHNLSGTLHSGTLSDTQAPQFLKTDGSRTLTGNLAVGTGVTIDGVDVGAHAAATAVAGHGTVGAHNHQTTANGGTLDHGSALTGLGDDDHTQYLNSTRHNDTAHNAINHHALTGLGDDDHTQYLLANGTRTLTGNMAVTDLITIDGVDISVLNTTVGSHLSATATAGHGTVGAHNHQTTANGGLVDHGAGVTGLGDDDHTQYLLANGTRQLTGNMAVTAGVTIDGVDISAHAAATAVAGHASAGAHDHQTAANGGTIDHGSAVTGLADDDHTQYLNTTRHDTTTRHTLGTVVPHDDHGALGGLGDDDHSQYLLANGTRQLTGNMLVSAGVTIDGVDIGAHAAATAVAGHGTVGAHNHQTTANGGLLDHGAALSGLGDDDHTQYASAEGSGTRRGYEAGRLNLSVLAGNGLTGGGLMTASQTLTLGTPGTLGVSSTNGVTSTSHTHAITASDNPGANSTILESSPLGQLTLQRLKVMEYVGVGGDADAQFMLDVFGNLRAQGWIVGKHAIQVKDAKMIVHLDGKMAGGDITFNPTGHMGQVATQYGTVYGFPGKFGKAATFINPMTNLLLNPSFEGTYASGIAPYWSAYVYGAATGTRAESSDALFGSKCQRCTKTDATADSWGVTNSAIINTGSATNTISVWVKVLSYTDGAKINLLAYRDVGFSANNLYTIVAADIGVWKKLSITYTDSEANTNLRFYIAGRYQPVDFLIDGAMMVNGLQAPPYFDGSFPGSAWSSTAHASSSSSASVGGYLTYNSSVIPTGDGTIMCWFKCDSRYTAGANTHTIWYHAGSTAYNLRAYVVHQTGLVLIQWGNFTTSAVSAANDTWYHLAATKEGSTLSMYLNGVLTSSTSITTPLVINPNNPFTVGGINSTSNRYTLDGQVDDFAIINRALSANEIRAIYESDAPVFAETSVWSWRAPNNLAWTDEEGLWMKDAAGNAAFGVVGVDGKTWGGFSSLEAGDTVLGNNAASSAALFFDRSTGKLGFYGAASATPQVEIGTDGKILADAGKIVIGNTGIGIGATPPTGPATGTGVWIDDSGFYGLNANTAQVKISAADGTLIAGSGRVVLDATKGVSLTNAAATEVVRLGNLNGNWGYSSTKYGLAIGQYTSAKANIVLDEDGNLKVRSYATDLLTVTSDELTLVGRMRLLDTTSNISIGLAASYPKGPTTGTGVYIDRTGLYGVLSGVTKTSIDATSGLLTATDANITGTVTASAGAIAGWTINATKMSTIRTHISSSGYISFGTTPPTTYGNNVGAWIGYTSSLAKMSLYKDANNFLQWTGDQLLIKSPYTELNSTGNLVMTDSQITLTGAGAKIAIGSIYGKTSGSGIWIDNTGLFAVGGGVEQLRIDAATGMLTAGGGDVTIHADGIKIMASLSNGLRFNYATTGYGLIGMKPGYGFIITNYANHTSPDTADNNVQVNSSYGALYLGAATTTSISSGTTTSISSAGQITLAANNGSDYTRIYLRPLYNDIVFSRTLKLEAGGLGDIGADRGILAGGDPTAVTLAAGDFVSYGSSVSKSKMGVGGVQTVGGFRLGSTSTAPVVNVLSALNASSHPTNEANVSHFYSYGGYPRAMDARGNQYTLGDSAQIYLPLYSWYPSGAVFSILTNNPIVSFRDAQTDIIDTEFIVPMGWRYKTISVNVWWNASVTTGDVVWNTELRKVNTGVAVQSAANLSATITSTVPSGNLIKKDTIAFADASGSLVEGQAVKIRLFRSGTDAADTMAANARVLAVSVSAV